MRTKREGEESVLRCALGHIPLPIQYPKPPQNSSCTPERDPTVVGTEFLCLGQTPQETNTRPKGQSDITGEQPGRVLVCDLPSPPPPPRVLKDSGAGLATNKCL